MSYAESLCSNMSDMSVMYDGEEMDLEKFVDQAFAEIQTAVNNLQCATRNLMRSEDRGDTHEESMVIFAEIQDNVKEGISVFKEIMKTNKTMVVPKPKALKAKTTK